MNIDIRSTEASTFLTLASPSGVRLVLSSFGAGIRDVTFEGRPMALTPREEREFLADSSEFYGKTIGPVAGRLDGGKFPPLPAFRFPVNEKNGVTLHSESWDYAFAPFAYKIEEEKESVVVRFSRRFEPREGYPVGVFVEIAYRVYEREPRFDLLCFARPDAPAPLHLTNHVYWALDGETMGEANLILRAAETLDYDERLLPLRRIPVPPSLDFRAGKRVEEGARAFDGTALGGIDHAFFCPSASWG